MLKFVWLDAESFVEFWFEMHESVMIACAFIFSSFFFYFLNFSNDFEYD